jgi:hypothetical protein
LIDIITAATDAIVGGTATISAISTASVMVKIAQQPFPQNGYPIPEVTP